MSDDPPEPTPEERQRCAEAWSRAKREIEAAVAVDATRMPRKGRHAPAPDYTPRADIEDLPDRNASRSEVKAWEERQESSQKEREGQHTDGG